MTPEKPLYLIYFSLEISQEVLLAKLLALYCAEQFGIYLTINDIMSFNRPLSQYEYDCLIEAKEWLNKFNDNLIIFDKGLNSNILYRDTLELLNKNGKTEEINGKTIYTPNNPEQLVLGIIDHIGLAFPTEGRNIKEEMDRISAFLVNLKRKYRMSWIVLQQQNRDATSIDRRKLDLMEPGPSDIMGTSMTFCDSDVCMQIFYPFKEKLTVHRGYKIIDNNPNNCLRSLYRNLIISKNRYGEANKSIPFLFYGSVGWWKNLPPPDEIQDYSVFQYEKDNIPRMV